MFDDIFQKSVVPIFQDVFGTTDVIYRHALLTKPIKVVFGIIAKTMVSDESGNQQTVEIATIHVPCDATDGIPEISTRAIIEQSGKTWAIEDVVDISPSMATVTARRVMVHEHSQRNRK